MSYYPASCESTAPGRDVSSRGLFLAHVRNRVAGIYALLFVMNAVAWSWALFTFHAYPVLLSTAVLAYTFGLRHAVDADHIAAIDNVTRKLMQDGKKPVAVGFFFSLGHSTVVILASFAIAFTASALENQFRAFKHAGGLIGTAFSAAFLFTLALANIFVLLGVYRTFQRVKSGGGFVEDDLNVLLANRGFFARIFRPIFRLISTSWHMYPLGFMFGLGFDTATEIGLLGMSAAGAAQGLSIWSILVFPALFTAGMTLADTTDSIMMLRAYGWAFVKPIRKLYYNMTITFVSVVVAVVIGSIEILGVVGDKLALDGGIWRVITEINASFGFLGFVIIGIFGASWMISALVYRMKGYDRIEVTLSQDIRRASRRR